ncbi:MAG: TM0106 family RecB-like putative nuclease [Acidimicrobiales bacterium]
MARPDVRFGSFPRLLAEKGLRHEADCLEHYRAQGLSVFEVPERERAENFEAWAARIGNPLADGHDVIFQMPLVHDGIRGIADFLVRVEDPESGLTVYEPVDAKLARTEAKPGHILQLCFYADALQALTGHYPPQLHLWLGSGRIETHRCADFVAYWRRLRTQLATAIVDGDDAAITSPEPCVHCDFCEFVELCTSDWRDQDALHYVAGIRVQDRASLADGGIDTLAALACRAEPVDGVQPERLARLTKQADLQVSARATPDDPPPFQLIEPSEDPTWGKGFTLLPEPDEGDVFLDFEGHPFWRADTGLFFLFGLIHRAADGRWDFRAWWAHDQDEEAVATQALIEFIAARRAQYPNMHVYHYNHTERSALERLATDHGVGEVALAELVETGCFVDLLVIARNSLQVGVESYGLKYLERLTAFERGHDIDQGAGAVVEYENFTHTGEPTALERIAAYNEDDVRATMAFRDWLVDHRPAELPWRAAVLEPDEGLPELDGHVEALHAFGPDTPEHLLGDLLGYWRREWSAHIAPKLIKSQADPSTLFDDPEALAGLESIGLVDRVGKRGQPLESPALRFVLPSQRTEGFSADSNVVHSVVDGPTGYLSIDRIDPDAGEVDFVWNQSAEERGLVPSVVVLNDWVSPKPKPEALGELARAVIDPAVGTPNEVSLALLRRDLPCFTPGKGPSLGRFTDEVDEMTTWVHHLDRSYVAIQGPPGSGKTYCGSHMIRSVLGKGRRVGITAMSHHAVDNLLQAVIDLYEDAGDLDDLRAVKRGPEPSSGALRGVTYVGSNRPAANANKYDLVAGTTWLFAGNDMAANPVDVLFVDEAGQLALADALAASRSAHNVVLLGDPLQLPQVAQASHPGGGGASVLEHVLGEDATMPADRGVFLTETRRMHPDVTGFISTQIYEGRLTSHESCHGQATESGTGLRWIRAHHADRSTESVEEAELVAEEIARLMGTDWVNQEGVTRPLGPDDFMVVAPYNDQVRLIRDRLERDECTRGVPVGTVDKFQGREAAVVFFTMTTSSASDMTRGADFLFSRNRLNVAISRARCLAYLVCTEDLLNSRARNVGEMRLISTLCSFIEYAGGDGLGSPTQGEASSS